MTRTRTACLATAGALVASLVVVSGAEAARPKCFGQRATIVGTNAGERIVGTRGDDVIHAKGGDDLVFGRGGDDLICGGGGNDELQGQGGKDKVNGQRGRDLVVGQGKADVLKGGGGDDELQGGRGKDKLIAGGGEDVLFGQGGNDVLKASRGPFNVLFGGAGDDRHRGGNGETQIYVTGPGDDDIDGNPAGLDVADYFDSPGGITASVYEGTIDHPRGNDTVSSLDGVLGSDFNDSLELLGAPGRSYLAFGGPGNDNIRVGGGTLFNPSVVDGGPGDDVLEGAAGAGWAILFLVDNIGPIGPATIDLEGGFTQAQGAGNDTVSGIRGAVGTPGDDTFVGDDNENLYDPNLGHDSVDGGAGPDWVAFFGAFNTFTGGPLDIDLDLATGTATGGPDLSTSLTGVENTLGGPGDDMLHGDAASNRIFGHTGDDQLFGREGDDFLHGEDGNDVVNGGPGNDTCEGETKNTCEMEPQAQSLARRLSVYRSFTRPYLTPTYRALTMSRLSR